MTTVVYTGTTGQFSNTNMNSFSDTLRQTDIALTTFECERHTGIIIKFITN